MCRCVWSGIWHFFDMQDRHGIIVETGSLLNARCEPFAFYSGLFTAYASLMS